jgi:signal transduction histidine kinase
MTDIDRRQLFYFLPRGVGMDTITIEVPGELLSAAKLSPEDVNVELAHHLFKQGRITQDQARRFTNGSARLDEMFLQKGQAGHIDLDDFISWAAHDLKSPLNAMIGFTKVVMKGIDGPVTDLQITDLNTAYLNGQRMLTLTNNLIDMARLNNGEIKIEISAGDLTQTISETANRWKLQNPQKSIQIEINMSVAVFNFDMLRMRQIINSLLTYAANHVAEEGKLTLLASDDDKNIRIDIKSSGKKAVDKFEMDLTMIAFICRGLINLHGGSLNLGDDTGAGIELSFTLPKA